MSYSFADTKLSAKPVWHTPLLCVQWKTPADGQRKHLKRVEFYSKNKSEKLVHLVGFITGIFSTVRSNKDGASFSTSNVSERSSTFVPKVLQSHVSSSPHFIASSSLLFIILTRQTTKTFLYCPLHWWPPCSLCTGFLPDVGRKKIHVQFLYFL